MTTALAAAQQETCDMSLPLPPEFERAIRERVESGAYASADDVFAACFKALGEWEDDVQHAKGEKLRAEIQVGLEQFDRGQVVDGHEAFARARARLRERAASRAESEVQQELSLLGAEVQRDLDRFARGEAVNRDVVLNRMTEVYGNNPPPSDEFFCRYNAWRIAERVASGKYDSAGAVIHAALCWLEDGEAADAADDELRAAIEEGIRSAETEPLFPGDEVVAHMHAIMRGERP